MVKVTKEDLQKLEIKEEEQDELLEYLSEDSDEDEEALTKKLQSFEPLLQMDDRFPDTVIMVGVPLVGADRLEKLTAVLRKKISDELCRKGGEDLESAFDIELPMNEDGSLTRGCCFLTFPSVYAATHAARALNGYKIDKRHTFRAAMLDEFNEIVARDKDYKPAITLRGFTREDVRWWLSDPRFREQFVLRHGLETEVYWLDPMEGNPCTLCYDGQKEKQDGKTIWTELRVQWSPHGSYLATFHRQGIALWAGRNFEKKARLEHKEVKQIMFSPKETYMLSWDGTPASMRNEKAVKTWNVMTGEMLRQFPTPAATPRGTEFPHFLFSHDEKYLAKIGDKELCVYAMDPKDNFPDQVADEDVTPVKLLRDEKGHFSALKYPVEKFEWSPGDNIVSLWIRGSDDTPGRLILVDIPSRRELASKNVYNVRGAAMHWQGNGDFLCLKTMVFKKTGKKGRKEFSQLEIFRMREKDIPVDNIQLTDLAVQLHWEDGPSKRFVLVVQEEGTNNQSLRFFRVNDAAEGNVETNKRDTVMTHSFDIPNYMNFLKWSPFGSYFVLASLGTYGTVMFCHLNDQDKVEVLHQDEHYMCNEVRWSHCGRYLATCVVIPPVASTQAYRLEGSTGFNIWTFQGKLLEKNKKEFFYQFLWRPHPPTLLSEKQLDDIKKRMKEHSKRYEAEDERLRSEKRRAFLKQREEECERFQQILDELEAWKAKHPKYEEWCRAYEEFDSWFEWELKEEIIEEEIDALVS
ncbi:Eukaryotic translation initiation factor 3 subunit 9, putative [Eimeria acervulina]|uniref:Eukaryotic translation initiation factor 3 subunit B n=1 Tax=Eimeria acervulina TaxID=5801 RepID=U6GG54_EIMAC|nr:Eukaryotic translation initiation factor 3 subunit 9, putative [Eimeria acervulina]CDI77559.1 Eukaryotic translation initiation factor 3 subunit 9, putative [Eimeria acervulina]